MSVPVSSKAVKKENDMPQIYQLPLGALGTNCYIIPGEDSRAVVIDPASAAEVEMFLNTHGHCDAWTLRPLCGRGSAHGKHRSVAAGKRAGRGYVLQRGEMLGGFYAGGVQTNKAG